MSEFFVCLLTINIDFQRIWNNGGRGATLSHAQANDDDGATAKVQV